MFSLKLINFSPVIGINEDIRLQPAFEMTLDRQPANENIAGSNKIKKTDISSSSSLRFKNLFSTSKTDTQKANLISWLTRVFYISYALFELYRFVLRLCAQAHHVYDEYCFEIKRVSIKLFLQPVQITMIPLPLIALTLW